MNDDWRVEVDFVAEHLADAFRERLDAEGLEHELSRAFDDRMVVSRNGTRIFLYAGDREQAEKALSMAEKLASKEAEEVDFSFTRWHPEAEEWRPAERPLPGDDESKTAEHADRVAHERQESEESGYPEYEVRIDLPSHRDATDLVERLRSEGLRSVHRWKYVLLGAADEDSANELAERMRAEVPAAARSWSRAPGARPTPSAPTAPSPSSAAWPNSRSLSSVGHEEGPRTRVDRVHRNSGAGGDWALG